MDNSKIVISEKKGKDVDFYPPSTMPTIVYALVIVFITAIVGGALMYFEFDQWKKIEDMRTKITSVESEIKKRDQDGDLIMKATRLTSAVSGYKKYKQNELNWEMFLTNVEKETLKEITYTAFTIDREKQTFRIDGVAPSFRVVAEQLNLFNQNIDYKSAKLTTVVLRPENQPASRVSFSIEVSPKEQAFIEPVVEEDVFNLLDEGVTNTDETDTSKTGEAEEINNPTPGEETIINTVEGEQLPPVPSQESL